MKIQYSITSIKEAHKRNRQGAFRQMQGISPYTLVLGLDSRLMDVLFIILL